MGAEKKKSGCRLDEDLIERGRAVAGVGVKGESSVVGRVR